MILVIMGVGYAAFSSQLKISGTSNIASNWSVKITDIQSKVVSGTPANASEPAHTDTTATFRTRLTNPGDTMQYDVTVLNEGDIDAKLDKITVPESTNPAIGFEVSGIEEGSLLEAKQTAILTVIVKYNNVAEQPSNLTADLEITLDYSQAPEGYVPPVTGPTIGGQPVEVVESGDGLYADEYESGKYTYKGANPNNYITFNNETWRIISIDSDGTIKIIKNEHIGDIAFDSSEENDGFGSNSWARPADLNTYLNGEYLMTITTNQDKIVFHSWSIGSITYANNDLENQIQNENGTTWNGKIALPTLSEYLRADTNKEQCGNWKKYEYNDGRDGICPSKNWMFNSLRYFVVLSPNNYIGSYSVITVGGDSIGADMAFYQKPVSPSLYLSSDTILSGRGTESDPYIIEN